MAFNIIAYSAGISIQKLSFFKILTDGHFLRSSTNSKKEIVKIDSVIPYSPMTRILIRKHQFEVERSTLIIASSSSAPEIVSSTKKKEAPVKEPKEKSIAPS